MSDHELLEEVAEVERIEKIVQEKTEALKKKQEMLQKLKELHEQDLTLEAEIEEEMVNRLFCVIYDIMYCMGRLHAYISVWRALWAYAQGKSSRARGQSLRPIFPRAHNVRQTGLYLAYTIAILN